MFTKVAVAERPLPLSLKFNNIRAYGAIAAFTALSIALPWAFHQFNLAGATFLPMHFFVFAAALACGWQAGVIVGLLTPLASFVISGMPTAAILPQVMIEVTAYGLIAGLLRQKLNLRAGWALLGAMAGGRIALLAAVYLVYAITGNIYSPLGASATPLTAVWNTVTQAWPGMLIQLAVIPAAFWLIERRNAR
jgi:riboflavin transporter FmnP